MTHTAPTSLGTSPSSRLLALTLSAVLTLVMLTGIHTLAEVPDQAVHMAHVGASQA